jgi:hypothetical protein
VSRAEREKETAITKRGAIVSPRTRTEASSNVTLGAKRACMSIYATLWTLKFPRDGDEYPGCEWIAVTAQGVPSHIGSPTPGNGYEEGDPYAAFLPPPLRTNADGEANYMRAVVFVTERTPKGTERSPQEYLQPLLVLTGKAYASMPFETLHARLCKALRGDRPRVVATFVASDGRMQNLLEDGTAKDTDRE